MPDCNSGTHSFYLGDVLHAGDGTYIARCANGCGHKIEVLVSHFFGAGNRPSALVSLRGVPGTFGGWYYDREIAKWRALG